MSSGSSWPSSSIRLGDLWGSYLFGDRLTGLQGGGGRMIIGNASIDFDACEALMLYDPGEGDPTYAVACRLGIAGEPEIVWARYRKAFTFDLSDFEEQAFEAAASALSVDGPTAEPW